MPSGTSFTSQALSHARAFFQGSASLPAWFQAQTDLLTSSEAAARILSTLPVYYHGKSTIDDDAKNSAAEEALHRGRMLKMEFGSLSAISKATPNQLEAAAGLDYETAMALQTFFLSKPTSESTPAAGW